MMEVGDVLLAVLVTLSLVFESHQSYTIRRKPQPDNENTKGRAHNSFAGLSPTKVIDKLLQNYNNQEPPMKDRPTEVQLGIYVNSFYSISEQTMDYSVSMYLRQAWRDPRLSFPPIHKKILQVRLGEKNINSVWIPDTFFRNEKRATFHEVTVNNRLMRLNATGHIWYVTKISATLSCPMKLQKYPMDTQSCPMMFESFGYTMDTLYFAWIDKPVDIEKNLQLPQFSMQSYNQRDCSQNYTAGAFPCLEIRFILQRDIGFFLIQVYVPSMLIVILSWVSFWINVEASPARVSIGLLTVLTTTTQSTGVNASLPRVSYIKAVDLWMSMCLIFVFAALLEYAVVNVLSRKKGVRIVKPGVNAASRPGVCNANSAGRPRLLPVKKYGLEAHLDQVNVVSGVDRNNQQLPHQSTAHAPPSLHAPPTKVIDTADGKMRARRIDKISRSSFPLVFLLFNVVYWTVYTIPSSNDDDDGGL